MKICKYCKKEFESGFKLGGHIIHCTSNPNKEKNELNSRIATKNKENVAWNKGLTKETDIRVLKNSESIKKSLKGKTIIPWSKGLTKYTDARLLNFSKL